MEVKKNGCCAALGMSELDDGCLLKEVPSRFGQTYFQFRATSLHRISDPSIAPIFWQNSLAAKVDSRPTSFSVAYVLGSFAAAYAVAGSLHVKDCPYGCGTYLKVSGLLEAWSKRN